MQTYWLRLVVVLTVSTVALGCDDSGSTDPWGSGADQICVPKVTKCNTGNVDRCTEDGTGWVFYRECEYGCSAGGCNAAPCVPDCGGRQCGDDGCGDVCGHCLSYNGGINDTLCQAGGQCMDPCEADCLGRECGSNACGGTCGKCETGWVCIHNAQCIPQAVAVTVVDAVIGPGKVNHTAWDGVGEVPQAVFDEVAILLGAAAFGDLVGFLGSSILSAFDAPDPIAWGWLDVGEGFDYFVELANDSNNVEDTYSPIWPGGGGGWIGVPFTDDVMIQIQLFDADLFDDDVIGTVFVSYDDLLEAWAAGGKYWIDVSDQTQNQALLVGLVVTPDTD